MVSLNAEELTTVIDTAASFALDFDDAYQYSIAEKYESTIVSFDSDFDRTTRGRRPARRFDLITSAIRFSWLHPQPDASHILFHASTAALRTNNRFDRLNFMTLNH